MVLIKPAERLPADAKVGGDQVLGHDIVQLGIQSEEFFIAGFNVAIHERQQAFLGSNIAFICPPPEKVPDLVDLFA